MQTLLEAASTLGIALEGGESVKQYASEITSLDPSAQLTPGK
jgi:hypothetical protein